MKLEKDIRKFYHKLRRSRKLMKTVTYRISVSILAQVVGLIMFRRKEVNVGILTADMAQMAWYYYHEHLWEKRNESEKNSRNK